MKLYGERVWAGSGYSTVLADMDFETYSEAGYQWTPETQKWGPLPGMTKKGLSAVGTNVYAEHPSTDVLCLAYDLKDGAEPRLWWPHMDPPHDLLQHILSGKLVESWHSAFEFMIWENILHKRWGWPELPLEQTRCAMAKARAYGLPGSLELAGQVLGASVQKDKDGKALIQRFCIPRNPTKADTRTRIRPGDDPAGAMKLGAYCLTDIAAEAAISEQVPDLSPALQEFWLNDQRINHRGVFVDKPLIDGGIRVIEKAYAAHLPKLRTLTGGAVETASQVARMTEWMHGRGVHAVPDEYGKESLDAESLEELLSRPDLPGNVRAVLEIRELLAAGSVKKLYAMRARMCRDGRIRGLFIFHGARTGRYTGEGPQPQNLPSKGPEFSRCGEGHYFGSSLPACPYCGGTGKATEWKFGHAMACRDAVASSNLEFIEAVYGNALGTVAGCLRSAFIAEPGKELICSDYRAIEAVVLAAVAGEEWRLDVFRTHGKIYEESASRITGVPLEEFLQYPKNHDGAHHPLRKKIGKTAELASGYGGWLGAWKAFGAAEYFADDEIKKHILAWRAASPMIPAFWGGQFKGWGRNKQDCLHGIEGAAVSAILDPGGAYGYRGFTFQMSEKTLYLRMITGCVMPYHNARLEPSDRGGWSIVFEGWNTNPKMGPKGWVTLYTHGGKLTENIVQHVAWYILAHAQGKIARQGISTVLHVHDENVAEVPKGTGDVAGYEALMGDLPDFAKGWPLIAAGGWIGSAYRKD